jgi:hypothetical protein
LQRDGVTPGSSFTYEESMETIYVRVVRLSDGFTTVKEAQSENALAYILDRQKRGEAVGCVVERASREDYDNYKEKMLESIRNVSRRKKAPIHWAAREESGSGCAEVSGGVEPADSSV